MNYLHYEFDLTQGEALQVTLDKKANVELLDGPNFERYQTGQPHRYYGGSALVSPVTLVPPHAGHWHVVIDLGGFPGTVRASVNVLTLAH